MAATTSMQFPLKVLKPLLLVSAVIVAAGVGLCFTRNLDLSLLGVTIALVPVVVWGGFLVLFLPVVLHECAHMVAGKLCGYEFGFIRIGRLQWMRSRSKTVFREVNTRWFNGVTQMVPPAGRFSRGKFAFYVAAGPIANLAVGAVAAYLYVQKLSPLADLVALMTAYYSIAIGVVSLIPKSKQGYASDGMTLIRLASKDSRIPLTVAVRRVMRATEDLLPPERWNAEDLDALATAPAEDPAYGASLLCLFFRHMLLGQYEAAGGFIERAVATTSTPPGWFKQIHVNAAIYYGYVERDGPKAQASLSVLRAQDFAKSYTYPMAVAATHLAQGRYEDCGKAAELALSMARSPDCVESVYPQELEILKAIKSEASSKSSGTNVLQPSG